MYGQTEACPRISYIKVNKNLSRPSIGKAIPGGKLYVYNKNKKIHKKNTQGELVYNMGSNIFQVMQKF